MKKSKHYIPDVFIDAKSKGTYVKICAPMVRYSKVHFRSLVKKFNVGLAFTPMIMADSFCQNAKARFNEFSTMVNDTPLIVQFAAKNNEDFVDASKLVYPYADGIDLNCGCPQRWAMKDGYGCALLNKPEVIYDLMRSVRSNISSDFSVSVKVRLLKDLKTTIDFCRQLERCGITFITVHSRTATQKSSESINEAALLDICQSLTIPVIANGGIKTLNEANNLYNYVKCSGVMAASGILTNPALFAGFDKTPYHCIKLWMDTKAWADDKMSFQCYHHHLVFMLEKILTRKQKQVFNSLATVHNVDEFINVNVLNSWDGSTKIRHIEDNYINCEFDEGVTLRHSIKCRDCGRSTCYCDCKKYCSDLTIGKYYSSIVKDYEDVDFMESNIFDIH